LNEFFMHGKLILSEYLLVLFNKIFELGYFPKAWVYTELSFRLWV